MEPMKPEVMIMQVLDMPALTRQFTDKFANLVTDLLTIAEWQGIQRVFITGDGDSYHAARGVEMAFENIAGIPCEPMSAQHFFDYGAEWMPIKQPNDTLLLAISASGKTKRVVQSIERANEYGALTIAITGTADSPITQVANRQLVVALPNMGPSPGIRTYNASLMGLYLIAIRLGEVQGQYSTSEAQLLRSEIANLDTIMAATLAATQSVSQEIVNTLKGAQTMIWVGSGPSYGTAMFNAAKVVEAAGLFAVGQDLEEWWHVERFCYPDDMPVFLIAPPGRSYGRAVALAKTAKAIGHRLVAFVEEGDQEIPPLADFVVPVVGQVREEFSPLVYHLAANFIASYWAENLGRMLFHSDDVAYRQAAMQ